MHHHSTERHVDFCLRISGAIGILHECPCGIRCLGQGFVGAAAAVVLGTVGEEEVDDEADDGEDKDAEAPEQLGDGRAVGLEDLDCWRGEGLVSRRAGQTLRDLVGCVDLLKTMMSRTSTMKPMIPPPVPYCQLLLTVLVEIS